MHIRVSKPHRRKAVKSLRKFDAQTVANTDECSTFEGLISEVELVTDPDV